MTARGRTLSVIGLAGVIAVGFATRWWTRVPSLLTADRVTLFSVDGGDQKEREPPAGETLYGYPVLGKVEITDPDRRRALADALRDGLERTDVEQAKCFWPRHVLRIEAGGRATDYVICFRCQNYELYADGRKRTGFTPPFSRHVEPAFSRPLREAGVPIAAD